MLNKKVAKTFAFSVSVVCGLVVSGLFASSAHACVFDDVDHSVYTNPSSSYLSSLDSFDNLYSGKKVSVELLNKCDYMTGGDCAPLPPYASILDGVDHSVYTNPSSSYLSSLDSFDNLYSGKKVSVELLNKCDYMTGGDCAPLPPYASILDGVDSDTYVNPSSYHLGDLDSFDNLYSGKKASVELLNMGDYTTGGDYTSLPSYDFTFDGVNLDTYANPGNTNIDDDIRLDEVNAYDTISSDSEIENELLEKHKELAEAKLNAKIALPVPGSQHN
ncbi:hypothetical protein CYJ59_00385 [Gardnerella leopoldii]|uniref:Triacylglycerol lipase n=3 Tax=Bifidobacteriaceae TaxID=31953 RepID=A0ABX4SCL9_9BIFI|nr:hypothetical protein CYJ60_00385 [Gardnerella vaginalis]PKZ18951.1 hypothetical protein CYJ59_00385 [Gardnerella vaginalis]